MKTPADTTAAIISSGRFKNLESLLERADIEGACYNIVRGIELYALIDKDDHRVKDIPPFLDPVLVKNKWYIDLRNSRSKLNKTGSDWSLPEDGSIGLMKRLTFATMQWEDNPTTFYPLGNFGIICFGNWVGNIVANSQGLALTERNEVIVTAMLWAWCQKNIHGERTDHVLTADEEKTATAVISGNVGVERQVIYSMVRRLGYLSDIASFIKAIKTLGINRLNNLQVGTLITLVGTSFFGFTDTRYMMAVALEYPPYFYAMIYEAAENNRLYKKTNLAGVVEAQRNNHTARSFKAGFRSLVSSLDEK